jgi:hypothetical protein
MPPTKAQPPIYQLKITLAEIRPPIWRRIQVPGTNLLCCLHDALQAVFGWTDSHLHNFEKDGKYWGVPEYDDLIDESNVRLAQVLKAKGDSMIYVYDFGDNWRHEVVLEKIIPANEPMKVPVCLGGDRRCPPEDVGGVSGYEDFLENIRPHARGLRRICRLGGRSLPGRVRSEGGERCPFTDAVAGKTSTLGPRTVSSGPGSRNSSGPITALSPSRSLRGRPDQRSGSFLA